MWVLIRILSHADTKNTQKGVRISNFLLLMVVLKGHPGSEGVKCGLHSLCGLFQLSRQMKVKLLDAVHNYTGKGVSGRDKALDAIQQLVCI